MERYIPIIGKTYGLFGNEDNTKSYYSRIRSLTDELLQHYSYSEEELLVYIQGASRKKDLRFRRKMKNRNDGLPFLLNRLFSGLSVYTPGTDEHIRSTQVMCHLP